MNYKKNGIHSLQHLNVLGQNEDSFRVDIHLVFNSLNKMLSNTTDVILPTQVKQYFDFIFVNICEFVKIPLLLE